jgi:glycosyltransferase involved in cell wall biosynthesis
VTVRILHLRSSCGIYGAEGVILTLARETRNAGHEPIVATLRDRRRPSCELRDRAAAEGFETGVVDVAGRVDPAALVRLARLVRASGCDVIHTHDYKTTIMGAAVAAATRVPVVVTLHGDTRESRLVSFYEWLNYRALRFCSAVVAVSREIRDRAAPFVAPPRLVQIDNGIDIERLRARVNPGRCLREELRLPPATPLIGMVGRLAPEKGHTVMLEALRRLDPGATPPPHLVVAGEGPMRATIDGAARAAGLGERVHLLGARTDLPDVYAALTVLAQPSLREGLPLVLLEAAAFRRPIVASAVGAMPEALGHGEAGVLVRPGDTAALADAVGALVRDPARGEALGARAAAIVEARYSAQAMTRRYVEQVYEPVIRRRWSETGV